MKQKILSILLAITASAGITFAETYSGKCGNNLTWDLKYDELTISGTGEMWNGRPSSWMGSVFLPDQVKYVYIREGVTSIGYSAFCDMTNLTDVSIGESVTSIGKDAFSGCSSLTQVYIPNSITSIGDYAFVNCSSLTSFVIGNSNVKIGNCAFGYCTYNNKGQINYKNETFNISEIIFIGTLEDWCTKSFNPSSISSSYKLYINGKIVDRITIPNSITNIGSNAFNCCSSLKTVTIESSSPLSVGYLAFPASTIIYVPLGSLNAYKATYWKYYNIHVFNIYTTKDILPTSATITINASLNSENKNKYIASCGMEGGEDFGGNVIEYIGLEPESEYNDVPFFIRTTAGDYDTIHCSFSTSALTLNTLASKAVSDNTAILLAETNMSDAETSCGFEWRRHDQPEDMASNQVICPVANGLLAGRLKGLKDDVYYKYRAFYKSAAGNMYYGDWQYIFTGDATVQFEPVLYTYAAQFVSDRKATLKGYALAGSDDFTEQGFEYWAESRNGSHAPRRTPQDAIGEKHTVTGSGISMQVTLDNLDEGTVYKYRTYAKTGNKTLYGSEMTFTTEGEWKYTVTVSTENDNMGTVIGGGKYTVGSEVTIEAVAKDGYDFVLWSDGNTDNPRTITVHDDAEYTAVFKAKNPSSLTETELENAKVRKYISNGILYIERNGIAYTAQGQRLD